MRFKITLILELIIPFFIAFLLAGCFGGGGSSTYDGTWTAAYVDSGFILPAAASGATVTCSVQTPLPAVTLVNGAGSTSQTNTCLNTISGTQTFIYLISVAVTTSTGVVNAIVNGSALTGQCISAVGCGAQAGTQSLGLTR